MKTFNDLQFEPMPHKQGLCPEAAQAKMQFENGYGVSVLSGECFYSDGQDTFEVAVLCKDKPCYATPITDDVLLHLSENAVSEVMSKIQKLPPATANTSGEK